VESEKFDRLVRGAFAGASRRGVVRVGVGALAASALATLGLTSDDAGAKKKKKKKKTICVCTSSDASTCTTQTLKKNQANSTLSSNPCAYSGACVAGQSGCPAQCTGDTPVTCGEGCCPSNFSKCCSAFLDSSAPAGTLTCNPNDFNCCLASQGGGSCGGDHPVCCGPTQQNPFGTCTPTGGTCCTTEQGGGECHPEFPVCCLIDPADLDSGNCCPAGSSCCQDDADCGGAPGSCDPFNCCVVGPRTNGAAARGRGGKRQGHGNRAGLAAK
jgi:hypothetical protein